MNKTRGKCMIIICGWGRGMNNTQGRWMIMCCGCNRLLSVTGTLATSFENAAEFETREDGDTAATAAGWTTEDADGPGNHRCRECQTSPYAGMIRERGAYVLVTRGGAA